MNLLSADSAWLGPDTEGSTVVESSMVWKKQKPDCSGFHRVEIETDLSSMSQKICFSPEAERAVGRVGKEEWAARG